MRPRTPAATHPPTTAARHPPPRPPPTTHRPPPLLHPAPDRSLVTVWSAPNYCYRCGNVAAVLAFGPGLEREVKYFTETQENARMMAPRATVPYFL